MIQLLGNPARRAAMLGPRCSTSPSTMQWSSCVDAAAQGRRASRGAGATCASARVRGRLVTQDVQMLLDESRRGNGAPARRSRRAGVPAQARRGTRGHRAPQGPSRTSWCARRPGVNKLAVAARSGRWRSCGLKRDALPRHRPGVQRGSVGRRRRGPRARRTRALTPTCSSSTTVRPTPRARRHTPLARSVVTLPFNLGVGGAMRAGYKFALDKGYDAAVQVDADGQHDPSDIPALLDATRRRTTSSSARASPDAVTTTCAVRAAGRCACWRVRCRGRAARRSPTSPLGFRAVNRRAIRLFADALPGGVPRRHRRVAGDGGTRRPARHAGTRRHAAPSSPARRAKRRCAPRCTSAAR